ncbi:hypothetical protein ETB97_011417 [Aspergillus alliaceus]|uniref:Uncharacterized protein n=1 Tax=Petromyces alliaceus TaxID=209559 RepID=A0A8H6AFQ3_PETAA|nr:hypothetical protein ETB97_011417 [Aspergillus burnettii]
MGVNLVSDDGSTIGTVYETCGTRSLEAGDKFGKSLRIYKLSMGPWPKGPHLGGPGFRIVVDESLEMWATMLYTKVLGWTREEVEMIFAKMREEINNPSLHADIELSVLYGQKPEI